MNYFKKKFIENGVEWIWIHHWAVRPIYKIVKGIQWCIWKTGLLAHDPFFDECDPSFRCCINGYSIFNGLFKRKN